MTMSPQTLAFITDLAAVLAKHEVMLDRESQYDGYDVFCGFELTLQGPGIYVGSLRELEKLLGEVKP